MQAFGAFRIHFYVLSVGKWKSYISVSSQYQKVLKCDAVDVSDTVCHH